jgi:hypothetical protein
MALSVHSEVRGVGQEFMISRVAGPVDISEIVQGGWQNAWLGTVL